MTSAIALIFLWGFQERTPTKSSAEPENTEALASELLNSPTQEQPTQIWREPLIEQSVSYLLGTGLVIASSIVLVGGVLYLIRHGLEPAEYQVFYGEPSMFRSPNGVVCAVSSGSRRGIIQLGLLLLIATPVARVAFSLLAFLLQRDLTYMIVTLFVLAGLSYSLIGIVR